MLKILIAEDDAIMREILMSKLISAGYNAVGAESGDEAITMASTEKPDLILLDLLIPGKNGITVMRELSANTELESIPIIVISNSDDAGAIKQAKELGAEDFLIKAIFDSSDVVEKVNQILQTGRIKRVSNVDPNNVKNNKSVEEPTTNDLSKDVSQNKKPDMKTILIVEDDRFLREIAVQKLQAEGFNIATATAGNEALDYLRANIRPDVVILDLILPGMSGFEVLQNIKTTESLKSIPVLILSNLGQEEDIEKAKKLGADDYLVKANFSFAEIIKKIRAITDK
ncbi:MAG TPA: response regulator [Candidatus Paceibacterota bacterium]